MGKKRSKFAVVLMAVMLLATGCWDAVEVNELDLATMVILDKKEGEIRFVAEIPRIAAASTEGNASDPKFIYLEGRGADFVRARDDLESHLEKPLYLGTVRTVVVTENAAKQHLAEYLFRLRENLMYRQKAILTITREDVDTFIKFQNESDSPGGFSLDDLLVTAHQEGRTFIRTTSSYVNDILTNRCFVVHCVGLKYNELALTGYSIFHKADLLGFIPVEQSRGLIFLLAERAVWSYRIPLDDNFATVEVELRKKKIIPSYQDGAVRLRVQMQYYAAVQYVSQVELFPLDEQAMQTIEQNITQALKEEIQGTIDQSQKEYQCDYLRLGESFRIAYPDVYEKMNWDQVYTGAQIEIETKVDLVTSPKMNLEPK